MDSDNVLRTVAMAIIHSYFPFYQTYTTFYWLLKPLFFGMGVERGMFLSPVHIFPRRTMHAILSKIAQLILTLATLTLTRSVRT